MIPDETLAQWLALADAATRGPWTWDGHRVPTLEGRDGDPEYYEFATDVIIAEHHGECACRSLCTLELTVSDHDAAFIAAARDAVPALLAEVAELRRENATYRKEIARREALTPEDFCDMVTSNRRLTRGDMFDLLEKLGEAETEVQQLRRNAAADDAAFENCYAMTDRMQARIDAALALLDEELRRGVVGIDLLAVRRALTGEAP